MFGRCAFGYVNVFTSHVNVGFFHGVALPDPARLLQGTGKFMRHVKLKPGTATNAAELSRLIDTAYSDINARVEASVSLRPPKKRNSITLAARASSACRRVRLDGIKHFV